MDDETRRKVEEAVVDILRGADMEEATEYKVRSMAAERLGLDLSVPERKRFVRQVVEAFLLSTQQEPEQAGTAAAVGEREEEGEEEERVERAGKEGKKAREFDDDGDLIICHLSSKRRVTIQDFRGRTLVSIREYYNKDGKQLPSSKGISLTPEQWAAFSKAVPDIEAAVEKLG